MYKLLKNYATEFMNRKGSYIYYDAINNKLRPFNKRISSLPNLVYIGKL